MEQLRAPGSAGVRRMWLGVGLTIAFVALAATLIWASLGGLPVVDPFDRWLLVGIAAPLWLLAPVVGGFIWRPLTRRQSWVGSVVVGSCATAVGAIALWPWVGPSEVCFGTVVNSAQTFMPQAVLPSVAFGGGVALITWIVAKLIRLGGRGRAAFAGAGLQIGLFALVVLLSAAAVSLGHVCRMAPVSALAGRA
jgi:hypothetical protein